MSNIFPNLGTVSVGTITDPSISGLYQIAQYENERLTHANKIITTDHAYIHDGIAYRCSDVSASISAGSSYFYSMQTPASGTYVHMRPAAFASTANLLEIIITEDSTISGGTELPILNQNRFYKDTLSQCSVKKGVTVTASGTDIVGLYIIGSGGSASAPKAGGSSGSDNEILLLSNTVYSIEMKNIGSSTATVAYLNLFWYEETKNGQ